MKLFCFIILITSLYLTGCSTTYQMLDYPSKEKFNEDVNSSIKNRNFNVVNADSSFTCFEGSKIKDDSLYAVAKIPGKIPLKDIRDINYYGKRYEAPSASIRLKGGEELRTENVKFMSDSSVHFRKIIDLHLSLSQVRQVSYTNHWKGMGPGIYLGLTIGGIIGATNTVFKYKTGGNHPELLTANNAGMGGLSGMVIGAIIGYIIGWDNVYQFNP